MMRWTRWTRRKKAFGCSEAEVCCYIERLNATQQLWIPCTPASLYDMRLRHAVPLLISAELARAPNKTACVMRWKAGPPSVDGPLASRVFFIDSRTQARRMGQRCQKASEAATSLLVSSNTGLATKTTHMRLVDNKRPPTSCKTSCDSTGGLVSCDAGLRMNELAATVSTTAWRRNGIFANSTISGVGVLRACSISQGIPRQAKFMVVRVSPSRVTVGASSVRYDGGGSA